MKKSQQLKMHVDKKPYPKKPQSNEIGLIKRRMQTGPADKISADSLLKKIAAGHSICPAVMRGMKSSDWVEQQLFLVDIDNDDKSVPILKPKDALAICDEAGIVPVFYYQTFSYSKEISKFRLVFVMNEVITQRGKRDMIAKVLINLFPQSDKACINADRIFFGTNKKVILYDLDARITMTKIVALYGDEQRKSLGHTRGDTKCGVPSDLEELKSKFDFFNYLVERNGDYHEGNGYITFRNCEICGHEDDLVYYKNTNSFFCFSSSGQVGGSIIDYLMAAENLTISEAMHKFKYELCELEDWEIPRPLEEFQLPAFPVDCLPRRLREWVTQLSAFTATPTDMAAVASLAVLATATQSKFEIEGKKDYTEPLNLFILIIAQPGERKSAIMRAMTEPVKIFEKQINDRIKKEATESGENFKRMRITADDVTPEALTSILAESQNGISIFSAEGGLFETLAGRYSKKVSIDTVLKAHSGDSITVDRIQRGEEHVDKPCLTILLATQDEVLESLFSNGVFTGRGLTARFLFSKPASYIGKRKFDTPTIDPKVKESYCDLVNSLLSIPRGTELHLLKLSEQARETYKSFYERLEPRLVADYSEMADWANKFAGASLRIAGLLHCAVNMIEPYTKEVSKKTMEKAIKIANYFSGHAVYAYSLMGASKAVSEAKIVLKRLEKQNKAELSRCEIHHLCRVRQFKSVEDILPALDLLNEYGYLRKAGGWRETGGRPSMEKYQLNPKHFTNTVK